MLEIAIIIGVSLAVAMSGGSLYLALMSRRDIDALAGPSRDQRIAHYRGLICAARDFERTIGDDPQPHERLCLAIKRSEAAMAREHLRAEGIEV